MPIPHSYEKHVFLLTDGATQDELKCMKLLSSKPVNTVVHAFGIGNDVDKHFVSKCAELGGGSLTLLMQDQVSQLRSKVI